MLPGDPEELRQKIPVGRLGRPEEVADLALAMLRNAYLTNQVISLDGGMYAASHPCGQPWTYRTAPRTVSVRNRRTVPGPPGRAYPGLLAGRTRVREADAMSERYLAGRPAREPRRAVAAVPGSS